MAKSRDDLEKKLTALEKSALTGAVKATGKQPEDGRLTARERVETLLDPGTFVEEFMLAETQCTDFGMAERKQPSDGVVTGFGKIDGRPIYVFSQDRSIMAGSVGSAHAEKIAYVIQTARRLGVPMIGLNDSARFSSRTVSLQAVSHRSRQSWDRVSALVPIRRRLQISF
jgi:propionyl-CoA carboxylase beta chain